MFTHQNSIHHWVEDGLNFKLENLAGGGYGYDKFYASSPFGHRGPEVPGTIPSLQSVATGEAGPSTRLGNYGNETWGCVEIRSEHNNVIIEALAEDSVIRVVAPGGQSKTIIETGGTVDIIADKKITLRSGTEVEITAPEIDINGTNNVYIDGGRIDLNLPHPAPED